MVFGDILSNAVGKSVKTADNIRIKISPLAGIGFKIIGLPHAGIRERARLILNKLGYGNSKVLDAGCGIGLYSLEIAKRGFKVTGIDFEQEKINTAKELSQSSGIKAKFICKNLVKIKLKEKFDIILCSEVLEHIKNYQKVISNLTKLLEKDGKIIITVPKISKYSKNIENYKRFGHVYPGFTEENLKETLIKNNLKILEIKFYSHPFTRFALSLNERLYAYPILLGLFFYPLYFLSFFDFFNKDKKDGLFIVAKKSK
jgi:SAM-dependent methyltransferase